MSKQQLNLLLFPSDQYCRKLRLTDLLSHDAKVTLDKKISCIPMKVIRVEIEIIALIFQ